MYIPYFLLLLRNCTQQSITRNKLVKKMMRKFSPCKQIEKILTMICALTWLQFRKF